MWYFEPRIERKKTRYRSAFLVRLLGSKYHIILALVGYLLCIQSYHFKKLHIHPFILFASMQKQLSRLFQNFGLFISFANVLSIDQTS